MKNSSLINVVFKLVEISHRGLPEVISPSIGMATEQKIHSVLASYNATNRHLVGAFVNDILIGVIGIEIVNKNGAIKHIAVSAENQMHGMNYSSQPYGMAGVSWLNVVKHPRLLTSASS